MRWKKWYLILFLIWIMSLSSRLWYGLATMPFSQDQARDVQLIEQYDQQQIIWIPLGPKASVGDIYLPPWFYQIHLWLAQMTHHHPLTMLWYSIIIESLTPVIIGLIVFQATKQPTSMILSALVYVTSPMIISSAVDSWNPSTLPFFTALFLFTGLRYCYRQQWWLLVGHWLSLLMLVNLHFQTYILPPLSLGLSLFALWKRDWAGIIVSIILMSLLSLPYALNDASTGWQNTTRIYQLFTDGQTHAEAANPLKFIFTTTPRLFDKLLLQQTTPYFILGYIVLFGGITGAIFLILSKRYWQLLWLFICLLVIVIGFSSYRGYIHNYYLSLLYIFPAILVGIIASWKALRLLALILTVGLIGGSVLSFSTTKLTNQYVMYTDLVNQITPILPSPQIELWLSNNDERIPVEYLLSKQNIVITDTNPAVMVEICEQKIPCRMDTWMTNNQFTEESLEEIETRNPYQLVNNLTTAQHQVVIGIKKQPNIIY